jgi:MarR family transcriptional regulator, organic hydroperoxide resistance regulator
MEQPLPLRPPSEEAAPPNSNLGDVLEFLRIVWALDHGLQKVSKKMATQLGVTGPQRLVIRITGRRPGISPGELADILHVHPSTLTGVLRRLEQRGFVTRRADPSDARRALLELTPKGQKLDVASEGTVEDAVKRALEKLSPTDIQAAKATLASITDALAK